MNEIKSFADGRKIAVPALCVAIPESCSYHHVIQIEIEQSRAGEKQEVGSDHQVKNKKCWSGKLRKLFITCKCGPTFSALPFGSCSHSVS
jgi:hypothetical protein